MSVEKRTKGWLARPFINGKRGESRHFPTKKEAVEWEREEIAAHESSGQPLGDGPQKTTLIQAMKLFAQRETLYKKGWKQELNRINKWREVIDLPRLIRIDDESDKSIQEAVRGATLPRTFNAFRDSRLEKSRKADGVRRTLSKLFMADITAHHLQDLQNAMSDCGLKADTIRLELALLKRIFNVSRTTWNWRYRAYPFTKYAMPSAGVQRTQRVPVEKEQQLLEELGKCRSPFILPYVLLAIETTMRRGEVLFTATWNDVDLPSRTIFLSTDKAGTGRSVPLSMAAVSILEKLPRTEGEQRIFPITADQLQSAWRKACNRADIKGLRIHDLRHEGASRYAMKMKGNIFLLKKITGHHSTKMLERYVNLTNEELFHEMDASVGAPPTVMRRLSSEAVQEDCHQAAQAEPPVPAVQSTRLRLVVGGRA